MMILVNSGYDGDGEDTKNEEMQQNCDIKPRLTKQIKIVII